METTDALDQAIGEFALASLAQSGRVSARVEENL